MDNSRVSPPPTASRRSILGNAFSVMKNYFTPEKLPAPNAEETGITPMMASLSLNENESLQTSYDSFKTSQSLGDESIYASMEDSSKGDSTILNDNTILMSSPSEKYVGDGFHPFNALPNSSFDDRPGSAAGDGHIPNYCDSNLVPNLKPLTHNVSTSKNLRSQFESSIASEGVEGTAVENSKGSTSGNDQNVEILPNISVDSIIPDALVDSVAVNDNDMVGSYVPSENSMLPPIVVNEVPSVDESIHENEDLFKILPEGSSKSRSSSYEPSEQEVRTPLFVETSTIPEEQLNLQPVVILQPPGTSENIPDIFIEFVDVTEGCTSEEKYSTEIASVVSAATNAEMSYEFCEKEEAELTKEIAKHQRDTINKVETPSPNLSAEVDSDGSKDNVCKFTFEQEISAVLNSPQLNASVAREPAILQSSVEVESPGPMEAAGHESQAPENETVQLIQALENETVQQSLASENETVQLIQTPENENVQHGPAPENETVQQSLASENETVQLIQAPENENVQRSQAPEKEKAQQSQANVQPSQAPENETVQLNQAPENENVQQSQAPGEENVQQGPAPENETVQQSLASENETVQLIQAPENENVQRSQAPEKEKAQQSQAPNNETTRLSQAPENETVQLIQALENETVQQSLASENETVQLIQAPENETVQQSLAPENDTVQLIQTPENETVQQSQAHENETFQQRQAPGEENVQPSQASDNETTQQSRAPENDTSDIAITQVEETPLKVISDTFAFLNEEKVISSEGDQGEQFNASIEPQSKTFNQPLMSVENYSNLSNIVGETPIKEECTVVTQKGEGVPKIIKVQSDLFNEQKTEGEEVLEAAMDITKNGVEEDSSKFQTKMSITEMKDAVGEAEGQSISTVSPTPILEQSIIVAGQVVEPSDVEQKQVTTCFSATQVVKAISEANRDSPIPHPNVEELLPLEEKVPAQLAVNTQEVPKLSQEQDMNNEERSGSLITQQIQLPAVGVPDCHTEDSAQLNKITPEEAPMTPGSLTQTYLQSTKECEVVAGTDCGEPSESQSQISVVDVAETDCGGPSDSQSQISVVDVAETDCGGPSDSQSQISVVDVAGGHAEESGQPLKIVPEELPITLVSVTQTNLQSTKECEIGSEAKSGPSDALVSPNNESKHSEDAFIHKMEASDLSKMETEEVPELNQTINVSLTEELPAVLAPSSQTPTVPDLTFDSAVSKITEVPENQLSDDVGLPQTEGVADIVAIGRVESEEVICSTTLEVVAKEPIGEENVTEKPDDVLITQDMQNLVISEGLPDDLLTSDRFDQSASRSFSSAFEDFLQNQRKDEVFDQDSYVPEPVTPRVSEDCRSETVRNGPTEVKLHPGTDDGEPSALFVDRDLTVLSEGKVLNYSLSSLEGDVEDEILAEELRLIEENEGGSEHLLETIPEEESFIESPAPCLITRNKRLSAPINKSFSELELLGSAKKEFEREDTHLSKTTNTREEGDEVRNYELSPGAAPFSTTFPVIDERTISLNDSENIQPLDQTKSIVVSPVIIDERTISLNGSENIQPLDQTKSIGVSPVIDERTISLDENIQPLGETKSITVSRVINNWTISLNGSENIQPLNETKSVNDGVLVQDLSSNNVAAGVSEGTFILDTTIFVNVDDESAKSTPEDPVKLYGVDSEPVADENRMENALEREKLFRSKISDGVLKEVHNNVANLEGHDAFVKDEVFKPATDLESFNSFIPPERTVVGLAPRPRESVYRMFDPFYQSKSRQTTPVKNADGLEDLDPDLFEQERVNLINRYQELENEAVAKELANQAKVKEIEAEISEYAMKLVSCDERNANLVVAIEQKTSENQCLSQLVSDYEDVLKNGRREIEQLKEDLPEESALVLEKNTYENHLKCTEAAFIDVLAKYEKLKGIAQEFRVSLSQQEKEVSELRRNISQVDDMIQSCEKNIRTELEKVEMGAKVSNHVLSDEKARLTAQIRKSELALNATQEKIKNIITENRQLASICDELINGPS